MKREDMIELFLGVFCAILAIASLLANGWAKENNIVPLVAGIFALTTTAATFLFLSFNERHSRGKG